MNENPKTLFYHRKALLSKGLMMKQVHHQKTKGQNFQGTLFHIPRLDLILIVRMSHKFVVTFIIAGLGLTPKDLNPIVSFQVVQYADPDINSHREMIQNSLRDLQIKLVVFIEIFLDVEKTKFQMAFSLSLLHFHTNPSPI